MYGLVSAVLQEKGHHVFTVAPATTVRQAVRAMNEHGVGCLLVVEGGRRVGLFTERDVLVRVVDAGLEPAHTSVSRVMTTELNHVTPGTAVDEAMAMMTRRRCRHLLVMEGERLAGLVSIGDLTRHVSLAQEDHIQRMAEYIRGVRSEA
ncbi:MAG: CBS domain-containing protein [Dehalococcoidia bacterium]|nr:CBS domain-containing protein [Dehalococcoidia bacterium]